MTDPTAQIDEAALQRLIADLECETPGHDIRKLGIVWAVCAAAAFIAGATVAVDRTAWVAAIAAAAVVCCLGATFALSRLVEALIRAHREAGRAEGRDIAAYIMRDQDGQL